MDEHVARCGALERRRHEAPRDEGGRARPSFVRVVLVATQWMVVTQPDAAVVLLLWRAKCVRIFYPMREDPPHNHRVVQLTAEKTMSVSSHSRAVFRDRVRLPMAESSMFSMLPRMWSCAAAVGGLSAVVALYGRT